MFRWLDRLFASEEARRAATHAPGDRVVWCGMVITAIGVPGRSRPLVYSGTYVGDGPAPYVTIRHDGSPSDAQVRPERLFGESEYLALVQARGYPQPTPLG